MRDELLELQGAAIKLIHLVLHLVVLYDAPEAFLVLLTIEQGKGNAGVSETTCSTDAMHVVLIVRYGTVFLCGHIKIDDKLNLMHVEAAGKQVGSDYGVNRSNSELLDVLVSLLLGHITEDQGDLVPTVLERPEECLCELFGVHENYRLGAHREGVVDFLYEVDLALGWALEVELLHIL